MNKTMIKYVLIFTAGVVLADQVRSLPMVGKYLPKV